MSNVSQQVSKFPKIEKFSLNALNDYKYVYVFYFIQELIIFSEIGYEFRFPYSNILVHWQMERKLVRYSYLLYDKKKRGKKSLSIISFSNVFKFAHSRITIPRQSRVKF